MPHDPSPNDAVAKHESSSETAPSNELSGAVAPNTHEIALEGLSEEAIRSFVFGLLKRCEGRQGDESAASELSALIDAEGIRGTLVRAALIEELLASEKATLRSIQEGGSSDGCFRFADHIGHFVTVACGKEMTAEQRSSLLHCVESYIDMVGSADSWGAGAVRLLGHAVTVTNDLFLYSTPICLTQPEQASLGATYLRFLAKHDLLLSSPELYSKLQSPVDTMLEGLTRLNTPRRGETLKGLFMHVDKVCKRFLEEDGNSLNEEVFIGDPIDLRDTLLSDTDSWPTRDAAAATAEASPHIDDSIESDTKDDSFLADDLDEDSERDEFEEGELEEEELDDDELDDDEDDDLEEWLGDTDDEDTKRSRFLEADSDELDIQNLDMEESVDAESAVRSMKMFLAKAMRDCPSLQRGTALWRKLVFEDPALEPGSTFFAQGYAQTSLEALQSLLVAIPLSMQEDDAIAANFVGLLAHEPVLQETHGVDLPTAYKMALESLMDDDDIIEFENESDEELREAGYTEALQVVDATIRSVLTSCLEADWDYLQELSEIHLMGDEMRTLVHSFIERVWGRHDSRDPGSLSD